MSAGSALERAAATSLVGMAVFLGGWTMTFAALLFVWADLRWTADVWPPDGAARAPLAFPALATAVIAASSWTLARRRVAATVALGLVFVALQAAGWAALWRLGVTPASGRYGSLLYTFGAFHALHVAVGLVGLVAARAGVAAANWRRFWHFVGGVWLVLFAALYLAGCAREPPLVLAGGRTVDGATLARGRTAYRQYCRACHGDAGDGRGLSAVGLRPPPRDFTFPLFKFGHTPSQLPPDSELGRVVRRGLNGTAMHPWDPSDAELDAVLQYIKTFSPRWTKEPPGTAVAPSPDPYGPTRVAEAVRRGGELYHHKAQCMACHPAYDEHGAATRAAQLRDSEFCLAWKPGWQNLDERECARPVRVLPPDFARDPLRSVYPDSELVDLYRAIAGGIAGAAMPTWKGALPEDELWALAYYVRSLRPRP